MKVIAFVAAMLVSINSFAGSITYKKGTQLPSRVQSALTQLLESKCSYVFENGWEVVETRTESYQSPLDTLILETVYETVFTVQAMDNDGMHPYEFAIKAESVVEIGNQEKGAVSARLLDGAYVCSK